MEKEYLTLATLTKLRSLASDATYNSIQNGYAIWAFLSFSNPLPSSAPPPPSPLLLFPTCLHDFRMSAGRPAECVEFSSTNFHLTAACMCGNTQPYLYCKGKFTSRRGRERREGRGRLYYVGGKYLRRYRCIPSGNKWNARNNWQHEKVPFTFSSPLFSVFILFFSPRRR